jgi:hypothetical protein
MSHEPIPPDPELNPIEAALDSLAPARSRIDRDRVMFRAGQATMRPTRPGPRVWMGITAGLTAIALGEAALLAYRPPPRIIERVVVVREPAPAPIHPPLEHAATQAPTPPTARTTTVSFGPGQIARERLAWQVLRYGLDGLPTPPSAERSGPERSPTFSRQLLQEELRGVLDPGDHS